MQNVIAFTGNRRIEEGSLDQVVVKVKMIVDRGDAKPILIFDAATSRQSEIDLRGSLETVLSRLPRPTEEKVEDAPKGPGRPKLGVTAREVTLLPRHWEWLAAQPGGASVALRKLVEAARKASAPEDETRQADESAYRFMSVMAGNLRGYEEALRAYYGRNEEAFTALVASWPKDIREHAMKLTASRFIQRKS